MLCKCITYSCICEVCVSPALNRSPAIQCFEHSDVIKICKSSISTQQLFVTCAVYSGISFCQDNSIHVQVCIVRVWG